MLTRELVRDAMRERRSHPPLLTEEGVREDLRMLGKLFAVDLFRDPRLNLAEHIASALEAGLDLGYRAAHIEIAATETT